MRDQGVDAAIGALRGCQLQDVLDQQVRAIGLHICRRTGFLEAAQVRRDAAVAAMLGLREVFKQRVPDERGFGKAVQEQHQRPSSFA
ncbi:hypothetical protein D3C84_1190860 [compost metagenome]